MKTDPLPRPKGSHFDEVAGSSGDIYDVAIGYEFSKQNFQTAFEYSEKARARSLLELADNKGRLIIGSSGPDIRSDAVTPPKSLPELQAVLPDQAQVLQYAMLKDKLLIWLISNTDFIHEEKVIPLGQLNEILFRYLKLVSSPSGTIEDLTQDGSALYDILIKPVEKSLRKDKLLCVVPDKTLNYLPFAALISGGSRRYRPGCQYLGC